MKTPSEQLLKIMSDQLEKYKAVTDEEFAFKLNPEK